jgi:hypothetical protein
MTSKTSTTQTTVYDPLLGVEVVVLHPAVLSGFSDVLPRGASFVITTQLIQDSTDRNGASWLRYLDDAPAQERAFGGQMIARASDQPEPVREWVAGDAAWEREYRDKRAEIVAATPAGSAARRQQMEALKQEYGDGPTTSTILGVYAGDGDSLRGARG